MTRIEKQDLEALQKGFPPQSPDLIEHLTVSNAWLDLMKHYCLEQVIAQGGSKVKILHGGKATGKSHFLQDLKVYAQREGFFVVDLDLSRIGFHLTDSVAFYKAIAAEVDLDRLEAALTAQILGKLGYDPEDFTSFGGALTEYLRAREKSDPAEAKKDIRTCVHKIANSLELDFAFRKFLHMFMEAVVEKDLEFKEIARSWIRGDKIDRPHKTLSHLYETLAKHNARSWLYSLMEVIKFMGYKGVVILLDQFEAILPKSEAVVYYTPLKRSDVYQLIRQLIDDLDFFRNILILISGNTEILENEKHGLQSYHALWMRIQPGFLQMPQLNVYADLIDADLIFRDLQQGGKLQQLKDKLRDLGVRASAEGSNGINPAGPEYRNFKDLLQDQIHRP